MHILAKVTISAALVTGAILWALSGASSADPYDDVHQLVEDPHTYAGQTISVRGIVVNNTTTATDTSVRFLMQDFAPEHEDQRIPVHYAGLLPDAFGPKPVVVTGQLIESNGQWTILAEDLQVGCSSKY